MAAYFTEYSSPLGRLTIASDGEYITGTWIEGQKYFASILPDDAERCDDIAVFDDARKWLDAYFNGSNPEITTLKLNPSGSEFAKRVWKLLEKIPYGKTATYGDISNRMEHTYGKKCSPRAVGSAVAHNPISIIVPCHRVIGKDGSLTGYAGGEDKKRQLLLHEGIIL